MPIETVLGPGGALLARDQSYITVSVPTDTGLDVSYLALPAGGIYTGMAVGDFTGDGRDDLAVLDHGRNEVLIFLQDAHGNFQRYGAPIGVGVGPTDIMVADLNHDGWPDIVVTNGTSGDISVIRDGPGGVFQPEIRLPGGISPSGTVLLPKPTVMA